MINLVGLGFKSCCIMLIELSGVLVVIDWEKGAI